MDFRKTVSGLRNPVGLVVFHVRDIDVPADWSQVACDVLAQKYFRKAGIPAKLRPVIESAVPEWLWRQEADLEALLQPPAEKRYGSEMSAQQGFGRLARPWAHWGWKGGYFGSETDAKAVYDGMRVRLCKQMGA